ncbi:MAG: histidine kinase [Ilumatobacteraceae bacterium]|nr:histidine kinase [Ilumatobacteraceae bacterium]
MLLVVSELTANVLRHAGTPGELRVWDPRPDIPLRVEVSDGNLDHFPTVRPPSTRPATGGGLHLVDQIADCWGVDFTPERKTVWAEFVRIVAPIS